MNIAGYPLWWAGIDGLDVVLGGAIVAVLLPYLKGANKLFYLLVPSIALGAASGIVGWPVSTALNSDWSMGAKYACAVASIAFSLACVHFLAQALPRFLHRVAPFDPKASAAADVSPPAEPVAERVPAVR